MTGLPDLRAGPPARFRVVERDRRLIVVDVASGEAAGGGGAPTGERPALLPRQTDFSGSATLVTQPWYDAKGPRTLRLDPGSAAWLGRAPWLGLLGSLAILTAAVVEPLLLIPIAFALAQFGKAARRLATRWLDRIEAGTGS